MPNYLTKEEIRQWRSSLEKITLEEFAARLGKTVEESKPTNDVVDIVMTKGTSSNTNKNISDGFSAIAERAFERERQLSRTPFSIKKNHFNTNKQESSTEEKSKVEAGNAIDSFLKNTKLPSNDKVQDQEVFADKEVNIVLKKSLTDREQVVLDFFLNHVGQTVFAKDLAEILNLPRDYVYKYIKNLRAKIEGDKLKNAPSGGFILTE